MTAISFYDHELWCSNGYRFIIRYLLENGDTRLLMLESRAKKNTLLEELGGFSSIRGGAGNCSFFLSRHQSGLSMRDDSQFKMRDDIGQRVISEMLESICGELVSGCSALACIHLIPILYVANPSLISPYGTQICIFRKVQRTY